MFLKLPDSSFAQRIDLFDAIRRRRSNRSFGVRALSLAELAGLLWAGQGSSSPGGGRTAPSAGALYSLGLRLGVGRVAGLQPGIYRYDGTGHQLARCADGDPRAVLAEAALGEQPWLQQCVAVVALVGDIATVTHHFAEQPPHGRRGERYLYFEAGHVAQNIQLAATALGLSIVLVGGFADLAVQRAFCCRDDDERVLGLLAIGSAVEEDL